jgi:predicted alpha/beta hydrolase
MQEQVTFHEVHFVLDALLEFYSASSLKQQAASRHVSPLGHIILIPSQSASARYSSMLHV